MCERPSIDEVYLNLTDAAALMLLEAPPELLEEIDEEVLKSHILGVTSDEDDRAKNVREWLYRSDSDHRDKLLACALWIHYSGTSLHESMKVLEETKFTCSAGIAHNELMAMAHSRGISGEEVEGRLLPKSHGCGKTFPGPQALKTTASVRNLLSFYSF